MRFIIEVIEGAQRPITPSAGWNVGHLANLGILLSCDGFSLRLDDDQLNRLFDFAEAGTQGEVRDHDGRLIRVEPKPNGIIVTRLDDENYPNGLILDIQTLKDMGIEEHEDEEPASDKVSKAKDDTMAHTNPTSRFDPLEESFKRSLKSKKKPEGFKISRRGIASKKSVKVSKGEALKYKPKIVAMHAPDQ